MDEFSQLKTLEQWYRALGIDGLLAGLPPKLRKQVQKRIEKERAKSRGPARDFFIRQLRDMKISPMVETFGPVEMEIFAGWCGKAFALSARRIG